MDVAIVGGGAAGFFSAIQVKENYPKAKVIIFEKTQKVLSKVEISGGGRCNFTNGCKSIKELSEAYPRGKNFLKKAFKVFDNKDTMNWFSSRGVPYVIQDDNCVFPRSQNSRTIIDCFLNQTKKLGIKIELNNGVKEVKSRGDKLELQFSDNKTPHRKFDKVIITTGGSPKKEGLEWLKKLNHKIEDPVPSLFTFNIPNDSVTKLQGIVVEKALVSLQGTKIKSDGPLLITHWGISGPAVLKLSAFGARAFQDKGYQNNIQVNWVNVNNNELVMEELVGIVKKHSGKLLSSIRPYLLPERLWLYLIEKSELSDRRKWGDIGKKGLNKLVSLLTNDIYAVKGKTTFKDEFVTCGGVSLESIDVNTMQSKVCNNLYFAGEVLDIDGITGGYNFQAAWTTGFIAGKLK